MSRLVTSSRLKSPFASSIFKVNLIQNILMVIFFIIRGGSIVPTFWLSYVSVFVIWVNISPVLIWYYDERILPSFFERMVEIVGPKSRVLTSMFKFDMEVFAGRNEDLSEEQIKREISRQKNEDYTMRRDFAERIKTKYDTLFKTRWWVMAIPWCGLMYYIFLSSTASLEHGGLYGYNDYWFWIVFAIYAFANLMASTGVWGIIITLTAIHEISGCSIKIDPLHTDGVGGLSCFGNYAIATTLIFSSGALWLPLAFDLMLGSPLMTHYIYLIVFVWMIFTLLSFVYPTVLINVRAKKIRNAEIDIRRREYEESREVIRIMNDLRIKTNYMKADATNPITAMVYYFNTELMREEFEHFKSVKLYPFEIYIFSKLISSVVFPLLIWFVQSNFRTWFGLG
ncbi:MAG: hypothetical protein JW839_01800 [Candidatus Lokiarchaeota archaeon]|nr:hypothetical protein [Candidatus Lokiarchaeota archaeon]